MKKVISLIYSVVFLIISVVGWQAYTFFDRYFAAAQKELAEAKEKIAKLETENQRLEMANVFLKKTRRLAIISDIAKVKPEGSDVVKTTFSFSEVDQSDKPIGEKRKFTIDGDILYVDTMVIKFEDNFVEQGDVLKGTALCLFTRFFGDKQKPEDGPRIDAEGKTPQPYKLDFPDTTGFENELWDNFWKLAQDPEYAKSKGVRAAHGQAPSMMLEEGATYKLEMTNTGNQHLIRQ